MINLDNLASDYITQQHDNASEQIKDGIKKIEEFKAEVSKDLVDLCTRADLLQEKFKKFIADDANKLNGLPLLIKGEDYYTGLLKIHAKEII